MASFVFFLLQTLPISFLIYFITHYFLHTLVTKARKLPPGPTGWPVLGFLPFMGSMPHVTLAKLARQYGPIVYLKMGSTNMVVASTPDAARAFLKTLDLNFSDRPPNAGATHLAYNREDMVFADYGPRWKLMRKLTNLHMLGGKALESWAKTRAEEMGHVLRALYDKEGNKEVAVAETLSCAMANMIGQVMLRRRVFDTTGSESNELKDMVVELMTSAGLFNIGDFVPCLAWLDLQGIERGMKKLHKKFDALLTRMIEEHTTSSRERTSGEPDFLDVMMGYYNSTEDDDKEGERLTLTNIKALLLNLFTAGTDTSSSIIEWALAEMLKNPEIMKKAHQEMDQVIGRHRRLQESDFPNLPYFQAICKETYRLHPSTPLNLPRVAGSACEVDGYYIPKGTRLSVNIWAIGRDPDVWDDPLSFNPERFMSGKQAKIDPRGNDFELIPFGAGRRICAGTRMGIILVHYILGTLVHSFEWKLPSNMKELNMEEKFGLALQKKVPLVALVSPRLSPNAYVA